MEARSGSIPMWLTLGFALGIIFGWMVFKPAKLPEECDQKQAGTITAIPASRNTLPIIPDPPHDVARLGEVEELFQSWGGYSIWKNNVAQFALWNSETDQHSDFYEVRRANRKFYFRTLPAAEWPLIDHGEMVRCPLWFAETPERRENFYREHPEVVPGRPILRSAPKRPPLLPPLAPLPVGTESEAAPRTPAMMTLTPGAGL